jgi:hypothetical protein
MRREAAAAYVGVSITKFDQWVAAGRMPGPKRVDGCVIWDRYQLDAAFDDLGDGGERNEWDDVAADAPVTRQGETTRNRLRALTGTAHYDTDAYEQWLKGEIRQLPPGKYPGGLRVYAEGEWEAIVRASPMQKRDLVALEAYFNAKGTIGYVRGGGLLTTERLAARGYVEVTQRREDGRVPFYGITPAGQAEWLRISGKFGK